MIDCEQLFLYEFIEKGSRIVLYGLGFWGQSYLSQLMLTQYCDLIAVSDRKVTDSINSIPYIAPSDISSLDFDYIVVALFNDNQANEVKEYLINQGIQEKKIIYPQLRNYNMRERNIGHPNDRLAISLIIEGGLGDYIVHEAFYEKLSELIPYAHYEVCCNTEFGKIPFYGKNVRLVERKDAYKSKSDIIFHLRNSVCVDYINEERVKTLSPSLFELVREASFSNGEFEMSSLGRGKDLVLLSRAKYKNQNRYSFLGGDFLSVSSEDVDLKLNGDVFEEYKALGLNKYVTFNCWSDTLGEGKPQTKVWPISYYEELIKMLKSHNPDIEFIQVGAGECKRVPGADNYFLGQDLYLVEHVLKRALFHIDCEGGLVHLATALGTKCVVIFGPTPEFFYGYISNLNIVSKQCRACMGVIENWPFECVRGLDKPQCMYSITPTEVAECIYIEKLLK